MNIGEFLKAVIDQGIESARRDYARDDQKFKREGSIAGFEACRDKGPEELKDLLEAAHTSRRDARDNESKDYWWFRCYEAEVEFVCNVFSVILRQQGMPVIIRPTARGVIYADVILRSAP